MSSELVEAFLNSLESAKITLRFFAGSWSAFATSPSSPLLSSDRPLFDVVMTSETIYQSESVPSLLEVLRKSSVSDSKHRRSVCLVAAKVVYFGVGGSITDFIQALESRQGGLAKDVWQQDKGVSRRILELTWPQ